MKPYLKRVIAERKELLDKLDKLKQFMSKDDFQKLEADERFLLMLQSEAMEKYANVLYMRISNGNQRARRAMGEQE